MKYLLLLIVSLSSFSGFSQSISLSSTESRCSNSGTITVHVYNGKPSFSYEIYAGPSGTSAKSYPVTQLDTDSSTKFSDLIPGKYYILVVDQDTTMKDSIIVTGNYQEPGFSLEGSPVTCPGGSNGFIKIKNAEYGRQTYLFQIISPYTSSLQANDTFKNLAAGVYQIRMFDSCGNYQTRSYTLSESYTTLSMDVDGNPERLSCDSARFRIIGLNGNLPYRYRVVDPTNSSIYIFDSTSSLDEIFINLPTKYGTDNDFTDYRFEIIDACGSLVYKGQQFQLGYYPSADVYCDSIDLWLGSDYWNVGIIDSFRLIFSPDPLGLDTITLSTSGGTRYFFRLPNAEYSITGLTFCGDTFQYWFGYVPPALDSVTLEQHPSGCFLNEASITIELPTMAPDWHPPSAPYTFLIHRNGIPFDTIHDFNYNIYSLLDVDSGFYEIWAYNNCGDTAYNSIYVDSILTASLSSYSDPGCGNGDGTITSMYTTNSSESMAYVLLDYVTLGEQESNSSGIFHNIDTGFHIIMLRTLGWCDIQYDTVYLAPYTSPTVSAKQVSCINGTYGIKADPFGGNAPYTYFLRDPNNSYAIIRGPVAYDTFINLASGQTYNILVEDACGNTSNVSASPYLPTVNIVSSEGLDCDKSVLRIGTDTILQSSFSWTGPNGFTHNRRNLRFNPVYQSDTGEYILTSSILGGCLILRDTFQVHAYTVTTADITVSTSLCYGDGTVIDSLIFNLNANSPAGTETALWSTISIPTLASDTIYNPNDTASIAKGDSVGNYTFAWTITSDKGCISQDNATINADCSSPVPVELIQFTASPYSGKSLLRWSTASEIQNNGFEIQRSTDDETWIVLDFILGSGNSISQTNYEFLDTKPLGGVNYYRLKQIDFNGYYAYSPKRTVQFSTMTELSIFPNPAKDQITISIGDKTTGTLKILDLSGSEVVSIELSESNLTLLDLSIIRKGIYIVELSTANQLYRKRFIKQ